MLTFFKALMTRLVHFRSLYKSNFSVTFIHEGNTVVQLPRSSLFDALTGRGYTLSRSISYFHRPSSEALLRRVIYGLYVMLHPQINPLLILEAGLQITVLYGVSNKKGVMFLLLILHLKINLMAKKLLL